MHDHWKAYFKYGSSREPMDKTEKYGPRNWLHDWRRSTAPYSLGAVYLPLAAQRFCEQYRQLIRRAEQKCPDSGKRAQSKSRNLLIRFRDFEKEVLLFMEDATVPFTNNQGELDLWMTKVQQKISDCFRSLDGAKRFARLRSYILTCQKNEIDAPSALQMLFEGKRPSFAPN